MWSRQTELHASPLGNLRCEFLMSCSHLSGADRWRPWSHPRAAVNWKHSAKAEAHANPTCQEQHAWIHAPLQMLFFPLFFKKKKSVLKKNDHFSSFPALFLSQEHETFYSGSQILFLSGGGRSQGNGPPLGIYTGWEI